MTEQIKVGIPGVAAFFSQNGTYPPASAGVDEVDGVQSVVGVQAAHRLPDPRRGIIRIERDESPVRGGGGGTPTPKAADSRQQLDPGSRRMDEDCAQSDRMLMEGIREGDQNSFAILLERHWSGLVRFASRFTEGAADEAEDIVQETFLRVWRKRAAWTHSGSVGSYLYSITRNLALNARRDRMALQRREKRGGAEISERASTGGAVEDLELADLHEEIELALAELPERRREVFVLCRFQGLSHQEIAGRLGISRQTVANHMSAALGDLRNSLSHHLERTT